MSVDFQGVTQIQLVLQRFQWIRFVLTTDFMDGHG